MDVEAGSLEVFSFEVVHKEAYAKTWEARKQAAECLSRGGFQQRVEVTKQENGGYHIGLRDSFTVVRGREECAWFLRVFGDLWHGGLGAGFYHNDQPKMDGPRQYTIRGANFNGVEDLARWCQYFGWSLTFNADGEPLVNNENLSH